MFSNQSEIIHQSITRHVLKDITNVQTLFDERVITLEQSPRGLITIIEKDCYQAGCDHILYSQAQLAGTCRTCGGTICSACFVRCCECVLPICADHLRMIDGRIYCRSCAVRDRLFGLTGKALKSLHHQLSKSGG